MTPDERILYERVGTMNDNICILLMVVAFFQFCTLLNSCSNKEPAMHVTDSASPNTPHAQGADHAGHDSPPATDR